MPQTPTTNIKDVSQRSGNRFPTITRSKSPQQCSRPIIVNSLLRSVFVFGVQDQASLLNPQSTKSLTEMTRIKTPLLIALFTLLGNLDAVAQGTALDQTLLAEKIESLIQDSEQKGDAKRGSLLFHSPALGCWKCHRFEANSDALAPNLSQWEKSPSTAHLIESILDPSKEIAKRYQAKQVLTVDGQTFVGIPGKIENGMLPLQTGPASNDRRKIELDSIEAEKTIANSIMPSGQVNVLRSRQEFLDLVRYLIEISKGGESAVNRLAPTEQERLAMSPTQELDLDHAGLIADWNKQSMKRGQAIYERVCQNCHGTLDAPGSLPTSLRFAEGKFKFGSDPYSMYQTLTHGGGMMLPQTWMVPQQKYDVIHFIREHFLRPHNPSQYVSIEQDYLAALPSGNSRGPEPKVIEPWVTMDYGSMLITTIQFGEKPEGIAQKAIAIRLDDGPGGVARGNAWMAFEHDTLRMAAAWTGDFVDWNGIQFNGRHGVHLRSSGEIVASNPNSPGWSDPRNTASPTEPPRVIGRDNRQYGPLPNDWAKFKGIHRFQNRVILDYTVGQTEVLEHPNLINAEDAPVFVRTLQLESTNKALEAVVLTMQDGDAAEYHADGIDGDRISIMKPSGELVSISLSGFTRQSSLLVRDRQVIAVLSPDATRSRGSIVITTAKWNQENRSRIRTQLELLPSDLTAWTRGGPAQYTTKLEVPAKRWFESETWEVEELARPENNPWLARTRITGMDFSPKGNSLVTCTWDGDVWRVEQLNSLGSKNSTLTWTRIASGLFQPLGILWERDRLLVTCRDQIVALRDKNNDGEMDHYECFNSDHQVTEHFHEFAMGLQRNTEGDYFYAKSARHALKAVVPHHGTLLRVSGDGRHTDIIATGFRAANGVCLNDDGTYIVTDQEGHWNPKNRINWVREGGFYGNMFGYHDVTDPSDEAMSSPLCWITNAFDRSPAELLWAKTDQWGELNGKLLNLSYGYGRIYVVPHEFLPTDAKKTGNSNSVTGQPQGGMCPLPIPDLPTGMIRGRFSPVDGQLYVGGMFSWAGSRQEQEGGLFRIRYRGGAHQLPIEIHAVHQGIEITFSEPLDRAAAENPNNYSIKTWDLLRTKNYGSPHLNEAMRSVASATLLNDQRTIRLTIPELKPTRGMEITCNLMDKKGSKFSRVIHNTIYGFQSEKGKP